MSVDPLVVQPNAGETFRQPNAGHTLGERRDHPPHRTGIERTYLDFASLYKRLCAELPSQILPRFPGKLLLLPRVDEDAHTADSAALVKRQAPLRRL